MYIPTWLDMLLLISAFVGIGLQYRLVDPKYGPVLNIRFLFLVLVLSAMLFTIFLNRQDGWLSLGLFVVALSCLAVSVQLFRMLPLK